MADAYESKCPLCGTPRAKGQKRCICNYTFEYERESGPFRRVSGIRTAGTGRPISATSLVVFACGLVAGGAAFAYVQGITPPPDEDIGLLLVPIGIFALAGGLFDWSFFFQSSRARRFVWLFGRTGARVFYGILGGALAGGGASLLLA